MEEIGVKDQEEKEERTLKCLGFFRWILGYSHQSIAFPLHRQPLGFRFFPETRNDNHEYRH